LNLEIYFVKLHYYEVNLKGDFILRDEESIKKRIAWLEMMIKENDSINSKDYTYSELEEIVTQTRAFRIELSTLKYVLGD
jgi:hypothetical protein